MKKIIFFLSVGFSIGWYSNNNLPEITITETLELERLELDTVQNNQNIKETIFKPFNFENDIISLNPLVVKYTEDISINFDTAYRNNQLILYSSVKAYLEKDKFDSLNKRMIAIYNTEITRWSNPNDFLKIEHINVYKTVKKLHINAINKFLEYAYLEMKLIEAETAGGRLQTYYKNNRWVEILANKNLELEKLVNRYTP